MGGGGSNRFGKIDFRMRLVSAIERKARHVAQTDFFFCLRAVKNVTYVMLHGAQKVPLSISETILHFIY